MMVLGSGVRQVPRFLLCGFGAAARRGRAEFGTAAHDKGCGRSSSPDLSRQFCSEKVDFLYRGRSRQQLIGLGHKRRGDGAAEMGLPTRLVGESVKDAERARAELKREPHGRRRLTLRQRQGAFEKRLEGRFLSRLGFKAYIQCEFYHRSPRCWCNDEPEDRRSRSSMHLARSTFLIVFLPCLSTFSHSTGFSTPALPRCRIRLR